MMPGDEDGNAAALQVYAREADWTLGAFDPRDLRAAWNMMLADAELPEGARATLVLARA